MFNLVVSDVWVFRNRNTVVVLAIAASLLVAAPAAWADPPPAETVRAFAQYVDKVAAGEAAAAAASAGAVPGRSGFLWIDESPVRRARVRADQIVIEQAGGGTPAEIPGGLIHDWIAGAFIPGAHVERVIAVLEDYDRHKVVYGPDVADSRLLTHDGDRFTAWLRLVKKKVITVVLDTVHDATFTRGSGTRWQSRSATTEVREVRNPGGPTEVRLPPGEGRGYMWALQSFWRLEERDGGVYLECRAVSLSRGIPTGLGWLIGPIVNDLPSEALTRTMDATRRATMDATRRATMDATRRATMPAPER